MRIIVRRARPRVLYEDPGILIVDKPSGLLFGSGNDRVAGVPETFAGSGDIANSEPFLEVQRGDPDQSGVAVYARDPGTQAAFQQMFDDGAIEMDFDALVAGYVEGDGEINKPISYDKPRGKLKASGRRGRDAVTRYRVVERVLGHTWVEAKPDKPRPEQVRVHLASIGHPLAIDPVYGGTEPILLSTFKPRDRPSARHEERPLIARLTLHVRRITFQHPNMGLQVSCEAELPRDLGAAIRQLGRLL